MTACVDCGAQFSGNWQFCPRCGNPVACPTCGTIRPAGHRFCPKDGHAFALRTAAHVRLCPYCDSVWEPDAKFCIRCGRTDSRHRRPVAAFVSGHAVLGALIVVLLGTGVYFAARQDEAAPAPVGVATAIRPLEPPQAPPLSAEAPPALEREPLAPQGRRQASVAAIAVGRAARRPAVKASLSRPAAVAAPEEKKACGRGVFGTVRGLVVDARTYKLGPRFGDLEQQNLNAAAEKGHYALIEDGADRVRPFYPPARLGKDGAWWCAQYEGKHVEVSGCIFPSRYHGVAAVVADSARELP